jgi:uncharacterized protein YjhX (UPF0386 family)
MQDLVQKLSYVTDMNAATARTCLERNGWDYAKALANFYELKVNSLYSSHDHLVRDFTRLTLP